jgi:hypothetical protein
MVKQTVFEFLEQEDVEALWEARRGAVGGASRASQTRGDEALREVDGSCVGAADSSVENGPGGGR